MFRASSCPSSGAQQLQWQPLVLPLERGGSSAVGRGRAGMEKLLHLVGDLFELYDDARTCRL